MYKFKEGSVVVFYGDSITNNGLWVRRVYDYYLNTAKIKCLMYNLGVSGNSSERAYARIDKVFEVEPTDVVIMFGMNDVSYSSFNKGGFTDDDVKALREHRDRNFVCYKKIVEELSERGINLVFCTPTGCDELSDTETPNPLGVNGAIKEISDRMLELAKSYGGNVIDFNAAFFEAHKRAYKEGGSLIGNDRVHPNAVGYEFMAKYFLFSQGFDIKYDLTYGELKKESEKPYSAWEEKRRELELKAKACDYARYDYFWNIKGEDELVAAVEKAIETHEASSWAKGDVLKGVEQMFKDFLNGREDAGKYYDEYIAYTKTAMK